MSRALFIATLKTGLAGLPPAQIAAIVSDYEHHFSEAEAAGQSEAAVAARLGDPVRLAQDLRDDIETRQRADFAVSTSKAGSFRPRVWALVITVAAVIAVVGLVAEHNEGQLVKLAAREQVLSGEKIVVSDASVHDLGFITQDHLDVTFDGGGRLTARGRLRTLTLRVNGTGSVDFGELQANRVDVELNGSGTATVFGTEKADISVPGRGIVRLKVKPKLLTQSVTGTGRVEIQK